MVARVATVEEEHMESLTGASHCPSPKVTCVGHTALLGSKRGCDVFPLGVQENEENGMSARNLYCK